MTNPSIAAHVSPFKVSVYVFAATQIASIPIGHAVLVSAVLSGGCVAYNRLPEQFRVKTSSKYATAKQILRNRFAQASGKIRRFVRQSVIRVQRIASNGVLIILIWGAFVGESFHQFVETIRLSAQVWAGELEPVFATVQSA